ncbi:MAG: hypothetical protein F6K19_29770 [Cyanothece sp. SIO1E1]|nr:hypothetical protein [Cyanothece sp. SIO1E1]
MIKQQLLRELTRTRQQLRAELDANIAKQRFVLLKNAVKWSLGALVAGSLLIYIWRLTK